MNCQSDLLYSNFRKNNKVNIYCSTLKLIKDEKNNYFSGENEYVKIYFINKYF